MKDTWRDFVQSLKDGNYVMTMIIGAAVIVSVVWFAFRSDNERKDAKIEQLQALIITTQREMNSQCNRRVDSVIVDSNKRVGQVQDRFEEFRESVFEEMRQRQVRTEGYVNSSRSIIKQYKKQVNETGNATKQLDSASKSLPN